jgi:CRP-like cAMP-binding protein
MTSASRAPRNRVLASLSAEDNELIEPFLQDVELPFRQRLQAEHRTIEFAYFPDSGIASVVAIGKGARLQSEVGLVGFEGMTGWPILMGSNRTPFDVFMQVEGAGRRIAVADLLSVTGKSPTLQYAVMKSAYLFLIQTAHTALANAHGQLEERLARWLLMACDRSHGDEMILTHEFLALMLGVRRAGVTMALQHLSVRGLIETARGSIIVKDREGLEEIAGGLYGVPEAEFERLFHD